MQQRLMDFATGRPVLVYVILAVLTLGLGSQLPRIRVDTDPENMLPADQPDRAFHNQVKARFALHDAIVVGAVNTGHAEGIYNTASLAALHRLTEAILRLDGVIHRDVMSLSTVDNVGQGEGGSIRFEWMMRRPPDTAAGAQVIRERIERLPLLEDTLVSGDGRAAIIYVPIERKDESHRISREILDIIATLDSPDDYHITGLPVAEDTFGYEMFVQMGISAPLAAVMILLLMLFFFRNLQLVIAPLIVAMVTVITTMGLLIGLGFTVHIMSSMIPIFLMPIAVVDSVHIMSEFVDAYGKNARARDVIRRVVDHLFKPMLFTSLTSAAGFLSLTLTPIPPVQVFGAFVAFGILLAFVLTIIFIPAYIVRMKPKRLERLQAARTRGLVRSPLARALRWSGRRSATHAVAIVAGFVLVAVVSVAGITRIQINDNPVRWFKSDHRIRVADRVLNEHFAGTYNAYLVLEHESGDDPVAELRGRALELARARERGGPDLAPVRDLLETEGLSLDEVIRGLDDLSFTADPDLLPVIDELLSLAEDKARAGRYFQRPAALHYIDRLSAALAETGAVGKVNALPDAVKVVTRELLDGSPGAYRIPDSQNAVAQTLLQYQSSHRPHDLWHMVTPDYGAAALWLQLQSGDNQDMTGVMEGVAAWLSDNPLPDGVTARWAGKTYINVVWQEAMVRGMLLSLLGAFVIVLIMMMILFRSPWFGLIAMLPLSVTITFIYGLIGWIGKDYDMPIAVLSALTLGLSIDFAIHFIQRTRDIQRQTRDFRKTMDRVFEEPARAIARNAIVIAVGFTPLLLAPLVPYITVGVFLAAIMATSAVVTLVLLPATLSLLRKPLFRTRTPAVPARSEAT